MSFWGFMLMVGSIFTMASFPMALCSLRLKISLSGSLVKAGNLKVRLDFQMAAILLKVNSPEYFY
jgi:hypothetical protein